MSARRLKSTLMIATLLGGLAGQAWGDGFELSTDTKFTPPQNKNKGHLFVSSCDWPLQRDNRDDAPAISGKVSLACFADDKDDFVLDVDGLKPKTTYSVWMVTSSKPEADRAGVGPEPFTVESDTKGHLHLGTPLKNCPLGTYKWLEVREHADGKVSNLEGSTRVARVRMRGE